MQFQVVLGSGCSSFPSLLDQVQINSEKLIIYFKSFIYLFIVGIESNIPKNGHNNLRVSAYTRRILFLFSPSPNLSRLLYLCRCQRSYCCCSCFLFVFSYETETILVLLRKHTAFISLVCCTISFAVSFDAAYNVCSMHWKWNVLISHGR